MAEPPTAPLARVDPDGTASVAATGLAFPNGAVITADGHTLVVAETFGRRLAAFDIDNTGQLSNRRVWADLSAERVLPDGICLDAEGAIWVANARSKACVRVAEGGAILDRIETSQPCYACALGGPDGRTLFLLTAPTSAAAVASTTRNGRIERAVVGAPGAGSR